MSRLIFLDTETTGLSAAQGDRIIEIACVEMVNRRLTKNNFHRYVNPERDIDPGAQAVHGISLDFLADKPIFKDIADEFLQFVQDDEIIIHNAAFDVGFLNAELVRAKKTAFDAKAADRIITDTLKMAREQFPGRKNSLDALCERFEIDNSARTMHGALLDCELLAEVYLALTRGQDSLDIGLAAQLQANTATSLTRPANLKILRATLEELQQHSIIIEGLQKASGGKAVWSALSAKSADGAA